MLPGADQVRRKGPARRCADDLRAMAEGRAAHRLPDGSSAREAVLALGLTKLRCGQMRLQKISRYTELKPDGTFRQRRRLTQYRFNKTSRRAPRLSTACRIYCGAIACPALLVRARAWVVSVEQARGRGRR